MTSLSPSATPTLIPDRNKYLVPLLVLLFATALIVRLYQIDAPPFDAHTTRQFHSALIAREMYFERIEVPEWRRELAQQAAAVPIEPPVLEWLSIHGYLLTGRENLAIPRILSATFWLIGGVFLFLLARLLTGVDEALFATGYYLLSPYALRSSRIFQPEPLMMLLVLAALYLITRWSRERSLRWAVLAGLASGAAILVKPPAMFALVPVWGVLLLTRGRRIRALIDADVILFAVLVALPVVYYAVSVFLGGSMSGQLSTQFRAGFWGSALHWAGWFQLVGRVFGYAPFIGGLLGVFTARPSDLRTVLAGWWVGYILTGQVFSYAFATHDYYHLQFVPLIGLSVAVFLQPVMQRLAEVLHSSAIRALLAVTLILITSALRARELRFGIGTIEPVDESLAEAAAEIGEVVAHSDRVIMISQSYCGPLQFYAEIAGLCWPSRALLMGEMDISPGAYFEEVAADADFFVVTDGSQWDAQPELAEIVMEYQQVDVSGTALVYDLR